MAYGSGAVKDSPLSYAEAFSKHLGVPPFDYRNFGRGGGGPRQLISISIQLATCPIK